MAKGRKTGGRIKGVPNKVTADTRAIFQAVFDHQVPKADGWFERVADDNPGKALESLLRLAEHFVPKLSSLKVDLGQTPIDQIIAELERRASSGSGSS